jgi:hypothetical protein
MPSFRVVLVNVATPPDSVAVPSVVLPFMNVTLPVGVPADEDTDAENDNDCP